jgi:hypothetical protein
LNEFRDEAVKAGVRMDDTIIELVKEKAKTLPPTHSCKPEAWKHLGDDEEGDGDGTNPKGTTKGSPA